ncbi:PLP-dependent aminotransferase family protein [Blastococcus sp. TF02A_35]|uniref:MocR-like transcription factor YczR n=1 Tax=Blastococcus sp. TF02A-35 TaxID=2559612 RepID=UPI0010748244|nr:PLP-dependent aminotransferase family protein [Blastococcus sp. TF02A_35]TFV47198.1 PLP-dependent aminotransferase family protein [Blastococcus sp. TF02A_35]
MLSPSSRVSAAEVARLLGAWEGSGAAYAVLATRLRGLLLDGRLPLGARLPSERELTAALPVSRTTVSAAYEQLRAEGVLVSRRGAGSWLTLPDGVRGLTEMTDRPRLLDFSRAAPTAPLGVLHEAMTAAVTALPAYLPDPGYELVGLPQLRAAIAESYRRRGLPTDGDQILVTSGAQHGLALVLRTLLDAGDRVLVDSPTYPNALLAIAQAGGRTLPVALPADGWDFDALVAGVRQGTPKLAYLVPDFHNPTGALLDAAGRARLVETLRATRTLAIVDETLVDLRLDGPTLPPPVAALDDTAITLGSMSKSCWGGLRIGWVRAQPAMISRLAAARPGTDLGTPVLEQLAATYLLDRLDQVTAPHRAGLRERRDVLTRLLTAHLPDWRWTAPHGGLVLWVHLPLSSTALAMAAQHGGLLLTPGTKFGSAVNLDSWLRLPFTQPIDTLREAVDRLSGASRGLPEQASPTAAPLTI